MNMKQPIIFSGNLAADASVTACKNGSRFIRFVVAVGEHPAKDADGNIVTENGAPKMEQEWYRCQYYIEPTKSDACVERLTKGRFVAALAFPIIDVWLNKEHEPQGRIIWNVVRLDF